jgi:hypothetical protein
MLVSGPWMLVLVPFVLAANHRWTFVGRRRDSKLCSAMRTQRIAGGCGGTPSADESYLP